MEDLEDIEMREQLRLSQKMGITKNSNYGNPYTRDSYDKSRATLDSYTVPNNYAVEVNTSISSVRQTVLCTKSDKLVGVKEDERYEVITLHPFVIRSLISGSVISEADPTLFILA